LELTLALNREWHLAHRMPQKATREQRIKWHAAHAAACGCRAIPESIRLDVEKLLKPPRKR
jgi:hypothetical protein